MDDKNLESGSTGGIADERFQAIANRLPVILWRLSADTMSDWVSEAWTAFTGAQSGNQTGFAWLDLVHPADRGRVTRAFDRAFEARQPLDVDFRLKRWNGDFRWVSDKAVPVYGECGFEGFVGVRLDVHRERRSADLIDGFRMSLAEMMLLERDR